MKKVSILMLCLVLAISCGLWVMSAGGDASDPVVSLRYLEEVFRPSLHEAMASPDAQLRAAQGRMTVKLAQQAAQENRAAYEKNTAAQRGLGTLVLKHGDVLRLFAGCKVTLLSGAVTNAAALVNVTMGEAAGSSLIPRNLYMQTDAASGGLTVTSATAELLVNGTYGITPSADAPDYGSLADALGAMGLFRGTSVGYELEGGTTRAQGLVMFLRMLGKEKQALASTASIPFADAQNHWARPYIAYAYSQGLTNGISATEFSPNAPVTAQHYLTFLHRALHYAEGTDFSYATVLDDAAKNGLFSQAEVGILSAGSFQRYKLVYLSHFALYCTDKDSGRLMLEDLISAGAMTEAQLTSGMAKARTWRIQ